MPCGCAWQTGRMKRSAGILLFRDHDHLEVLLGHMGGPFWHGRDERSWSLPKGEHGPDETPLDAAYREFEEELGLPVPDGQRFALGEARQHGGKVVTAWAVRADLDPADMVPGTFTMEWPPGSGRVQRFPELDRVAWFTPDAAASRLVAGQQAFLDRLIERLRA
jgi:predicted NUDIX family NTP pyrophosphohydrolase